MSGPKARPVGMSKTSWKKFLREEGLLDVGAQPHAKATKHFKSTQLTFCDGMAVVRSLPGNYRSCFPFMSAGNIRKASELLLGGTSLLLGKGEGDLALLCSGPLSGQILPEPRPHDLSLPRKEAHHGRRHR